MIVVVDTDHGTLEARGHFHPHDLLVAKDAINDFLNDLLIESITQETFNKKWSDVIELYNKS